MAVELTRYEEVKPALHINVDVSSTSKKHFLDLSSLTANLPKGSQRFRRYDDSHRLLSALKRSANPSLQFNDPLKKVVALQESLEVLFFEDIIMDVLIESSFFPRFLQLREHKLLVIIMVYDFQKHRFCQRPPHSSDTIPENMRSISEALWSHRVKLSATLARMRVGASAQSITQLLPPIKFAYFSTLANVPVYTRVTCSPTSEAWTLAISELQSAGISFVQERRQLKSSPTSATFVTKDLLAFSPDCRSILYNSGLRDGPISAISPQDFTSYMSIVKLGPILQSLGEAEQDLIVTNCDNGTIPAHISSLMRGKGKVMVFGITPVNIRTVESNLSAISVNNVQLIPVPFPNVDPSDDMFANVGLVLCNVPCSLTSVLHPVDYIMQEGDQSIAQVFKTQQVNIATLLREQRAHLSHALKFSQAKYLVYFTRSNLAVENRDLVDTVMCSHETETECNPELHQYEIETSTGSEEKGYLCVLKQIPKAAPPASDVITQAILRGVISSDGILEYAGTAQPRKKKKVKKRLFSHHEGIPMTFAAQQKIVRKKTGSLERSRPFLM